MYVSVCLCVFVCLYIFKNKKKIKKIKKYFVNCHFWGVFFSIIIFRQVLWNKHLYFKLFNTLIFFLFWQLSPLMVDSGFKLIKNCLCYYVQCIAIYHHGMVVWFLQQTLNFHSTYELVFMQSFCTYIYPNYGRFYSIPFKWGFFCLNNTGISNYWYSL